VTVTAPPQWKHGTQAGYLKHLRYGPEPCPACTAANTAYQASLRAGNPELIRKQQRQAKLRNRALMRLRERHPEEYEAIYRQVVEEDEATS
jgi:hypothetical protein